jgi:molecular chaperone DnaJ
MDFYLVLGVAHDASSADIKRAYRRLARRYHPGINPGDRAAETMFRRISEAYETLVDPRRRQQYDATGVAIPTPGGQDRSLEFTEFDFSRRTSGAQEGTFSELFADVLHPVPTSERSRPEVGADLHASLTLSFVDAVQGTTRQVVVTRHVPCGACGGAGRIATPEGRCSQCEATGKMRWARGYMVFAKVCSACGGSGRRRFDGCPACAGHGRAVRSEPVLVPVPAGIPDGARLRVAEKGHAGRHGGRTGDLYVTVHVQPHPFFRREADDLVCIVPVAMHEAVLGARIDVPLIDGAARLRIPPGTQGGQRFRLTGRGVPTPAGGQGDLIIEVQLVLPHVVDERSKELMREFGRLNQENVRRDMKL